MKKTRAKAFLFAVTAAALTAGLVSAVNVCNPPDSWVRGGDDRTLCVGDTVVNQVTWDLAASQDGCRIVVTVAPANIVTVSPSTPWVCTVAQPKALTITAIGPGQAVVTLTLQGWNGAAYVDLAYDTVVVTVVKVDLDVDSDYDSDIDDTDDPIELSEGGRVALNEDDDNANGTADKDETASVTGENDLEEIKLKLDPTMTTGTLTLEAMNGSSRIKVWDSATKGTQVVLPKTWTLSSGGTVPTSLYVEGVELSYVREVELRLRYTSGSSVCDDSIKMTVVKTDLDIDSDYDGDIDDTDDPLEVSAGGLVFVNKDDDNANGTADKDETASVTGENDLKEIQLKLRPTGLSSGTLTLEAVSGSGKIKVWDSATKGTQVVLPKTWAISSGGTVPASLYVEGIEASSSQRDVELRLRYTSGNTECNDSIKLTVISVDLDIDSDNSNALSPPDRDDGEEALEDDSVHPGKALAINELDRDKDGVPDFVDGYDIDFGSGSQSGANASRQFVPVVLQFSKGINTATATVRFEFGGGFNPLSNPANVSRSGAGTKLDPYVYAVTDFGKVRLWNKNGDEARNKAAVPSGNAILRDTDIKVSDLAPDANGNVRLYLEALSHSTLLGNIKIKVDLDPDGTGPAASNLGTDKVKATVFRIENVHPIGADFVDGDAATVDKVGAVMISTKQDADKNTAYYTRNITSVAGNRAQSEDATVTISAYILPKPPAGYAGLMTYFEVIDPDDLSHYEGKAAPGTPAVQGNTDPNDNRDPNKQMTWNSGAPAGYDPYQAACLSARSAAPVLAIIGGTDRAVAEVTLNITARYAGDNYQVRATMQNPYNEPFDTLSGMTAGAMAVETTVKASEKLIAWKRIYIEQDNMYTVGCTITAAFAPDGDAIDDTLTVDSSADFSVGDLVVIFWQGGSQNAEIRGKAAGTVTVGDLPLVIPRFAGIRPRAAPATYALDRRYLPAAFGQSPSGDDGGAFIEFHDVPNGSQAVPKYGVFPNTAVEFDFALYWFNNSADRQRNVLQLLATTSVVGGTSGVTRPDLSICIVHCVYCAGSDVFRDEVVVHEIGHRFDLTKATFPHIDDGDPSLRTHDDLDFCVMDYASNFMNGITEFAMECLVLGTPAPNSGISLRDRLDE